MPHVPNLVERLYVLRANRAPGTIYDLLGSWTCKAVVLAHDVGVFDALRDGPATVDDLATRLDCHPETLAMLCRFLARSDYLDETDGRFRLSGLSERWLVGDAGMIDWLAFWDDVVYPYWDDHAEAVVRTGHPDRTLYEWLDDHPEHWVATQRGFEAGAGVLIDPLLDAISLPANGRLLDVGGGHGRYAIAACERTPGLRATIVDDPMALDVARENVAAAGLEDRIAVQGVDVLATDLADAVGADYDVAFCFNLVHGFDPAENERLVANVHDALAAGGRIVVVDQFEDTTGALATAKALTSFIGLAYRVLLGGRVYPAAAVEAWCTDAGFHDADRTDFRRAPGVSMLAATRD